MGNDLELFDSVVADAVDRGEAKVDLKFLGVGFRVRAIGDEDVIIDLEIAEGVG